jgi:hypothetical protein
MSPAAIARAYCIRNVSAFCSATSSLSSVLRYSSEASTTFMASSVDSLKMPADVAFSSMIFLPFSMSSALDTICSWFASFCTVVAMFTAAAATRAGPRTTAPMSNDMPATDGMAASSALYNSMPSS